MPHQLSFAVLFTGYLEDAAAAGCHCHEAAEADG